MSKSNLLFNPRFRSVVYQVMLCVTVIAVIAFLARNAITSLEKQGIASGFDFLQLSTGFDIAFSLIDYDSSSTYLRLFFTALINTLLISIVSIIAATIIGFFVGILRLSTHPIISRIAGVYVETLRNIPLLLQVFFWYVAVLQPLPGPRESLAYLNSIFINNRGLHFPSANFTGHYHWFLLSLLGVVLFAIYYLFKTKKRRIESGYSPSLSWWVLRASLALIALVISYFISNIGLSLEVPKLAGFNFKGGFVIGPEFFALFIALSTYTGAYIAENVRSGIQSVNKGLVEASRSVGLSYFQTMRLVVIPNAMRVIIPPLTNQYLNLTKNSSLAAAIAYPDLVLVFAGTALNQTAQSIEILFMVMLVYLFISLVISVFMNWYNSRMKLIER